MDPAIYISTAATVSFGTAGAILVGARRLVGRPTDDSLAQLAGAAAQCHRNAKLARLGSDLVSAILAWHSCPFCGAQHLDGHTENCWVRPWMDKAREFRLTETARN